MKTKISYHEKTLSSFAAVKILFVFFCGAVCAPAFSAGAQETDNYYWRGGTWGQSTELLRIDLAGNWAADSSGETVHEISPSETSNLIFDYANIADRQHARINVYDRTVAVNSVASYVPTEMHMQYSLTVLSDWTSSVSSDTRYSASYRTDDNGDKKSVRFAADTANFLTVGGDMTLSTDKYFTSRIRLGSKQGSSAYTLTIGGALSFVKNCVDAVGYHAFDMIAFDSTTGTAFALDVGGLRSSGKAVYMTTAKNGSISVNFNNNPSGVFAGGDCASGPASVIKAIAAAKVVAANIDEYLGYHHQISCDVDIPEPSLHDRTPCGRVNLTEREACERVCDFDGVENCMTEKEARQEASRCLRCDHFGFGIFKGGRETLW